MEKNKENNIVDLCWKNFKATGDIKYYLLYKNIKEEDYGRTFDKSPSNTNDELSR